MHNYYRYQTLLTTVCTSDNLKWFISDKARLNCRKKEFKKPCSCCYPAFRDDVTIYVPVTATSCCHGGRCNGNGTAPIWKVTDKLRDNKQNHTKPNKYPIVFPYKLWALVRGIVVRFPAEARVFLSSLYRPDQFGG